jgi:hypothetical protein
MECYSHRARAEARVSILNTQDRGWYVDEIAEGFAVRHDCSPPPVTQAQAAVCIVKRRFGRIDVLVKGI